MVQAIGQRILIKKEMKINNFFILGSGIFMTAGSGILLDFEACGAAEVPLFSNVDVPPEYHN